MYLSLYCKYSKRVTQGLRVRERAGDRTELQYFDPHSYGRHIVSFLFSWCSTGGPEALSAGWWLPLLQLISIFSGPISQSPTLLQLPVELNSTGTGTQLSWHLSWLSYIIVQRPLDRPLDLWNRMFNRHQAEIIVMQLRGHSLPVRQFMRVSWDFLARPISSANFRPRDFLS